MMTYGWAILIIVIVAAVLYSLGVFNPAASIPTASVTGFSGLSITATCASGTLVMSMQNEVGVVINITNINVSETTGASSSSPESLLLLPNAKAQLAIAASCSSIGSFSSNVNVQYKEPGQIFVGPYSSPGVISGSVSSSASLSSNIVGGLALTGEYDGCYSGYSSGKPLIELGLPFDNGYNPQRNASWPPAETCLYNGTCPVGPGDGWTEYGEMYLGNSVTFRIIVDDLADFFYKPVGSSGNWTDVFGGWQGDNLYGGGTYGFVWPVNINIVPYTKTIALTPGLYDVAFASQYDHGCDANFMQVIGGAWASSNINIVAWNGTWTIPTSDVASNPAAPLSTRIRETATLPASVYRYETVSQENYTDAT